MRDGLRAAASLPPAAGPHHPAGPHTGRTPAGAGVFFIRVVDGVSRVLFRDRQQI